MKKVLDYITDFFRILAEARTSASLARMKLYDDAVKNYKSK